MIFVAARLSMSLSRLALLMHPKKWNILTWILLLLWGGFLLLGNFPFEPELPTDTDPFQAPDGTILQPATGVFAYIGFPCTYLTISESPNIPKTRNYFWTFLPVNAFLGLSTMFSIVYCVQTLLPKFSIKTFFVVTFLAAAIIAVVPYLISILNIDHLIFLIYAVFFIPLVVVFPTFLYVQFSARRSRAINRVAAAIADRGPHTT
jgi:hypothetical protein